MAVAMLLMTASWRAAAQTNQKVPNAGIPGAESPATATPNSRLIESLNPAAGGQIPTHVATSPNPPGTNIAPVLITDSTLVYALPADQKGGLAVIQVERATLRARVLAAPSGDDSHPDHAALMAAFFRNAPLAGWYKRVAPRAVLGDAQRIYVLVSEVGGSYDSEPLRQVGGGPGNHHYSGLKLRVFTLGSGGSIGEYRMPLEWRDTEPLPTFKPIANGVQVGHQQLSIQGDKLVSGP